MNSIDWTLWLMLHYGLETTCMAEAMVNEASIEGDIGMVAVGLVIVRRYNKQSWPNTLCEVIAEPSRDPERPAACAFSYTCDNKVEFIEEKDIDMYLNAISLYGKIATSEILDYTLGADHYLKCDVVEDNPWTSRMEFTTRVGRHCFFKSDML